MLQVALPDLIQLFQMVATQGGAPAEGAPAEGAPAEGGEAEKKPEAKKEEKLDMIMSKLDSIMQAAGIPEMGTPMEAGAAMPPAAEAGAAPPPDMGNALAPTEPIPAVDASGAAPPPPAGGMTVAASAKDDKSSRARTLSQICRNLSQGARR